ncbi:hypothetical protein H310_01625 [Aphanomyces invadans]|uniref:AAA+ ATPase domain-containing protein n=1 Tax=Aphanomyces invadans TaxID=157072 RepID=A0A024URW8_9STRA|nr:hypothetical protein H310_01625 [Aphanomyces invadans]ETW09201.1 hypothetical protein H310_01625 [Aphanomyces invadans]|eukprot:XP_008863006.1 hypothetical protein H310_01625 [Aphanomyces invadans]
METLLVVPRVSLPQRHDGSGDFRSVIYMEEEALHGDFDEACMASIHQGSVSDSNHADSPIAFGQVHSVVCLPHRLQDVAEAYSELGLPVALVSYGLAVSLQRSFSDSYVAPRADGLHVSDEYDCYIVTIRPSSSVIPAATNVTLHLPSLESSPFPSKIARAMEHVAGHLLSGTVVWHRRVVPITWRHTLEFAHVSLDASSHSALSVVDAATAVTVTSAALPRRDTRSPDSSAPLSSSLIDHILRHVSVGMAGYTTEVRRIVSTIVHALVPPPQLPLALPIGMVLSGVPGVGKSHILRLVQASLNDYLPTRLHCVMLSAPDLFHTQVGQSEAHLAGIFAAAMESSVPTLVCIEDLDAIASTSSGVALDQALLGVLLACLDQATTNQSKLFVVGTTNRLDALDPSVRRRLSHHVALRPPSELDRIAMLELMSRQSTPPLPSPSVLQQVAGRTSGFVGADLLHLVREAMLYSIHVAKCPGALHDMAAWQHGLTLVRPSSIVEHSQPSQVAPMPPLYGLDNVWKTLDVALLQPLQDSSPFRRMGIFPPKGVLITGPSGVGKSHLLAVLGAHIQKRATCLSVKCTDLVTKVVGGTEAALAALFATARVAAPCVLLFDQIESLAPVRGFDTTTEQTFDRVLSCLLTEMDGFHQTGGSKDMRRWTHQEFIQQHVVVVATTTTASLLDSSILRPGRFDMEIALEMPTAAARTAALTHLVGATPISLESSPFGTLDALVASLVDRTEGATIGQLHAVFQEAAMASLRESIHVAHIQVATLERACDQVVGTRFQRNEEGADNDALVEAVEKTSLGDTDKEDA